MTNRYAPPTRRSISHEVIVPRRPAHHCETSEGSVHARHTSSRGASNSRVTRISVSVGRVITAVPLLAIASLLHAFKHIVERVEALLPRGLIRRHPVEDRLQRAPVERVDPL